jgi:hypothetical protein
MMSRAIAFAVSMSVLVATSQQDNHIATAPGIVNAYPGTKMEPQFGYTIAQIFGVPEMSVGNISNSRLDTHSDTLVEIVHPIIENVCCGNSYHTRPIVIHDLQYINENNCVEAKLKCPRPDIVLRSVGVACI